MVNDPAAPVILDYSTTARRRRSPWPKTFLLLMLPGLAILFLPFAYHTSPWDVVSGHSWFPNGQLMLLAMGFFSAFPIVLLKLRSYVWRPASRIEIVIWYIFAILGTLPVLGAIIWFYGQAVADHSTMFDSVQDTMLALLLFGGPPVLLMFVGLLLGRMIGRYAHAAIITTGLLGAYLANALLCLTAFYTNPDLGYYLTVPVALAGLVELIVLAAQTFSPSTQTLGRNRP